MSTIAEVQGFDSRQQQDQTSDGIMYCACMTLGRGCARRSKGVGIRRRDTAKISKLHDGPDRIPAECASTVLVSASATEARSAKALCGRMSSEPNRSSGAPRRMRLPRRSRQGGCLAPRRARPLPPAVTQPGLPGPQRPVSTDESANDMNGSSDASEVSGRSEGSSLCDKPADEEKSIGLALSSG
jgi:hypothetical protein